MDERTDLQLMFDAINAKQVPYTKLWSYYDGHHPLVYSAERLREVFQDRETRFSQNWCGVVIEAELDRIHLNEFNVTDDEDATEQLNTIFETSELKLDAEDVHKAALVCGESFVFVWKNEDGIEAYYHDPRMCHVLYEQDNPRRARVAGKRWIDETDGRLYLNLYYDDHIEFYVSQGKATSATTWKTMVDAPEDEINPFGKIPVFHFRTDRRIISSRLQNVIEQQDALNKLFADMMVSAEFGAFAQRWIITNSDTGALKNAPNEIWALPAGDSDQQGTSVGQFAATDLDNYLNAIDKIATTIAIITRTPRHYMFATGDPSGEALIALEAPLVHKAQRAIDQFTQTWIKVANFIAEITGITISSSVSIRPTFDNPATVQPRVVAEIRNLNLSAGIPLVTTLRDEGWTQAEIEQMQRDQQGEEALAVEQSQVGALADAENIWRQIGLPGLTKAETNV